MVAIACPCPCMEIFHGNVSGIRWSQLLELVLTGKNSDARGETPRTLPAVHDINACSARLDRQLQLCRTR